jgi:hypothetical protein
MWKKTIACARNLLNNSRTVYDLNTNILPKKRKFLLLKETTIPQKKFQRCLRRPGGAF